MGLFQKIFDLVKEELSDEPKKPTKNSGSKEASVEKPKGDSFEQLCAKAKAGNLGAQFRLANESNEYSAEKLTAVSELFKEMMDHGDIEGKCIWGFLNRETPEGERALNQAADDGAFFGLVLNGFYYGNPIGLRRGIYDPHKCLIPTDVPSDVIIKMPLDPQNALIFLEKVASKLEERSKEEQSEFHLVYGLLTYIYGTTTYDHTEIQRYAAKGAEYNDPIALCMLGQMSYIGICGYEKNLEYANHYYKKAEKYSDLLGDKGPLVDTFLPWIYCMIGVTYDKSKNPEEATPYFEKAAKLGSLYAMFALSRYHELGILPKDPEKILSLRTRAIAGGFSMTTCEPPKYTI